MEDAWGWVDKEKDKLKDFGGVGAPLGASVQPSGEQAPAPMVTGPDATTQQLTSMALGKGIEATAEGGAAAIKAATAAPLAPAVVQGASMAPGVASIGSASPALTGALTSAGIPGMAASAVPAAVPGAVTGSLGTALGSAGVAGGTTAGGALASGAAGAGAMGAGGTAALAALGPVGLTVGGLLLAKKFGLF